MRCAARRACRCQPHQRDPFTCREGHGVVAMSAADFKPAGDGATVFDRLEWWFSGPEATSLVGGFFRVRTAGLEIRDVDEEQPME